MCPYEGGGAQDSPPLTHTHACHAASLILLAAIELEKGTSVSPGAHGATGSRVPL